MARKKQGNWGIWGQANNKLLISLIYILIPGLPYSILYSPLLSHPVLHQPFFPLPAVWQTLPSGSTSHFCIFYGSLRCKLHNSPAFQQAQTVQLTAAPLHLESARNCSQSLQARSTKQLYEESTFLPVPDCALACSISIKL